MISEASRDTEDWSYDAVLASQKLYIIENCNNFTILVFFFFHQINAALVSIGDLIQKHKTNIY